MGPCRLPAEAISPALPSTRAHGHCVRAGKPAFAALAEGSFSSLLTGGELLSQSNSLKIGWAPFGLDPTLLQGPGAAAMEQVLTPSF